MRRLFSVVATLLVGVFPALAGMEGHGGFVKGVAISPDGRQVLSASFDYTLML